MPGLLPRRKALGSMEGARFDAPWDPRVNRGAAATALVRNLAPARALHHRLQAGGTSIFNLPNASKKKLRALRARNSTNENCV